VKAPQVWNQTRKTIETNIDNLKKAIQKEYAKSNPKLITEIDKSLTKLDGVLGKLDTSLEDSLKKAVAAQGDAARKAELQNAKAILVKYIGYVKSEPLIAHMDKNPFGVQTNIKQTLTESLTHMAKAIS